MVLAMWLPNHSIIYWLRYNVAFDWYFGSSPSIQELYLNVYSSPVLVFFTMMYSKFHPSFPTSSTYRLVSTEITDICVCENLLLANISLVWDYKPSRSPVTADDFHMDVPHDSDDLLIEPVCVTISHVTCGVWYISFSFLCFLELNQACKVGLWHGTKVLHLLSSYYWKPPF